MGQKWIEDKVWTDEYFIDLSAAEKLIFLYLFTNHHKNMIGIYELPIQVCANETGLSKEEVTAAFDKFKADKKAYYLRPYIVIENHRKHQVNDGMNTQKGILNNFNALPCRIIHQILQAGYCEYLINMVKEYSERYGIPVPCMDKSVTALHPVKDKKPKEVVTPTNEEDAGLSIFEHWNKQPALISHRKYMETHAKAIKKALKDYTEKEIKDAIDRYNKVLAGNEYKFKHSWALEHFIVRGLSQFADDICFRNFKKRDLYPGKTGGQYFDHNGGDHDF